MLRRVLLSMSRSRRIRHLTETAPVSRSVVARFVAGTSAEEAVAATRDLVSRGLLASLDRLGEDTLDLHHATDTRDAYLKMLELLSAEGLTSGAEVSVKLSAVGQALPGDGEKVALENARAICAAAHAAGTTVTLDMEDHTTTDSTLSILRDLRVDFPETGAVLQAYLHRTEADCRDLAYAGSRVRLCKGAYVEPATVAFPDKADVDAAYGQLMERLLRDATFPAIATHDERLIARAVEFAKANGIGPDRFEFQMLFGVRRDLQERLARAGYGVRVYVPFGTQWYPYFMRRLAERPANVAFVLRSILREGRERPS